jgi:oligopeptide transport system ATP-binding protein
MTINHEMKRLITVKNLKTYFFVDAGVIRAADDVDLFIERGEIVGMVGESGAGKSVTALSIIKVIRPPGRFVSGQIWLEDENISDLDMKGMRKIRGKRISAIFQDPMSSLNPRLKIGEQISETVLLHRLKADKKSFACNPFEYLKRRKIAKKIAIESMNKVGIPDAEKRYDSYPHEFSGGMRQRTMIAMALSAQPDLLIADEPTTSLDVTVQAQILQLLRDLNRQMGMSVLIITHDMSVVSEICDRVYVMYAGKVHEEAPVEELFENPLHPYTKALLDCIPRPDVEDQSLKAIKGEIPDLISPPSGCSFAPRCQFGNDLCVSREPKLTEVSPKHWVRCRLWDGK